MTPFHHGDRIRYATTGEDGLPLVRYGFIGGVSSNGGPIVVMLDGELGGDVVDPEHVEPVHICNVTLTLAGSRPARRSVAAPGAGQPVGRRGGERRAAVGLAALHRHWRA